MRPRRVEEKEALYKKGATEGLLGEFNEQSGARIPLGGGGWWWRIRRGERMLTVVALLPFLTPASFGPPELLLFAAMQKRTGAPDSRVEANTQGYLSKCPICRTDVPSSTPFFTPNELTLQPTPTFFSCSCRRWGFSTSYYLSDMQSWFFLKYPGAAFHFQSFGEEKCWENSPFFGQLLPF